MKKFNFILVLLVIAAFMFSCSNDYDVPNSKDVDPEVLLVNPKTRLLTEEQAKTYGNKIIGTMGTEEGSPVTRAPKNLSVTNVEPIKNKAGVAVLYVLNFGKNQGYMILSADKESTSSMLAYSEEGTLKPENISSDEPMGEWISEQIKKITEDVSKGINKKCESYQIWEYINGDSDFEIDVVNFNDIKDSIPPATRVAIRSRLLRSVRPNPEIVNAKFGQDKGYNTYLKGNLAGCPAVAMGLLCYRYKYPRLYSYQQMRSSNSSMIGRRHVARMFYDIIKKTPNYKLGRNSSGARPNDTRICLHRLGYSKAELLNYKFDTAYQNIRAGRPVLFRGRTSDDSSGHIWIADGYMGKAVRITRRVYDRRSGKYIYRYAYKCQDYFYMNWGWHGYRNGWFESDSFGSHNSNKQMFVNLYPAGR